MTSTVWNVIISECSRAYEQEQKNLSDPYNHRDIDESDIDHIEGKRYKTKRGVSNYIDQFAMSLRHYMVFEHVETDTEIYLRCLGMMPTDTEEKIYEVSAYCQ